MTIKIRQAAVIGSGVMGGGIAAHLAGAGIKTLLLDIVPFDLKDEEKNDPIARNKIVKAGLDTVLMSKPPLLMQNKDKVFTRINLLSTVWGYDYYGGSRTVDVHMRRLRAKIPPPYNNMLRTIRNVGYMFSPKE